MNTQDAADIKPQESVRKQFTLNVSRETLEGIQNAWHRDSLDRMQKKNPRRRMHEYSNLLIRAALKMRAEGTLLFEDEATPDETALKNL